MQLIGRDEPSRQFAIVAIPANNEVDRIGACLAALLAQRDPLGAPISRGRFEVLVYANNCRDGTAELVRAWAARSVHPLSVIEEELPPFKSNAGWARKRAMDLAADRLVAAGHPQGLIVTTDADSVVSPTWLSATLDACSRGVDCVAGYIDALPNELMRLGSAFVQRGRWEDTYLRLVAEIYAVCDPIPYDPWPNHRVSSGASLAVTLSAYLSIGGLPPKSVGEDRALTQALEIAGFKVRHAMDVCVATSCRFDGRAKGGAADTMRHRHDVLEAPCDDDLEPALQTVRRALCKGYLRRTSVQGRLDELLWTEKLGVGADMASSLLLGHEHGRFEAFWLRVAGASPTLRRNQPMRPSELPRQIERASLCLRLLRKSSLIEPALRFGELTGVMQEAEAA